MKMEGEQTLLRVQLRNTDKLGWFSGPAAESLVQRARAAGLAGATVLRGFFGLDANGNLLESGGWSPVEHVPVVVEIVDGPRSVGSFLATVEEVVPEGLATLERCCVLLYRRSIPLGAIRAGMSAEVPGPVPSLTTVLSSDEFPVMKRSENGQLLRVFIGEADYYRDVPLYRAIVLKARELGLVGAAVLRGPMGFGANSRMHRNELFGMSTDLPVVVEIADSPEKVQSLLPFLDESVEEGLVTVEDVRVLRYHRDGDKARPAAEAGGTA